MERNKRGISLIVLVITIIVMIILAGAVIISLGNAGIIGKAQEAVDANNLKQVEQLAALAWSEAYIDIMEEELTETEKLAKLEAAVDDALEENNVNTDKYIITVTTSGVSVEEKTTLGALITDPTVDYGKLVDYEANGVTEWQVFYEDETNGYVFLIAKKSIGTTDAGVSTVNVSSLTTAQINLYSIFKLGQTGYTLSDSYYSNKAAAWLISNYSSYANTTTYGSYVVGAFGGPTIELLAAGYNAKYPTATTKIAPIVDITYKDETNYEYNGEYGYFINAKGTTYVSGLTKDELYIPTNYYYWLASPSAGNVGGSGCDVMIAGYGAVSKDARYGGHAVRPVVCLKSSIPAIVNGETGYTLLVK